jgi:hypothetical protein
MFMLEIINNVNLNKPKNETTLLNVSVLKLKSQLFLTGCSYILFKLFPYYLSLFVHSQKVSTCL